MTKKLYHSPLRLQKMLLSLQRYDLKAADTLSRNYLPETGEVLIKDLDVCEINLPIHLPVSKKKYAELQKATAKDPVIQSLIDTILEGWPEDKANLSVDLREYWNYRDEVPVWSFIQGTKADNTLLAVSRDVG